MEFKGTKGEWYKMEAQRMGVPFIICSGNETIFQAYGEYAEHNVNLALCAPEMLQKLIDIAFFANLTNEQQKDINSFLNKVLS